MWKVMVIIWLLFASVLDLRFRRVPVGLLAIGGVLGVAFVLWSNDSNTAGYYEAVKGMVPGALLLIVALGTKKAGCGDGIVLVILGMISGSGIFPVFGFSLFFIALFSILLLVSRRAGHNTRIPYLPFLTAAWLFVTAA